MRFERAVVASKNPDKIAEVEEVLAGLGVVGEVVRGLDWPDVDETEPTLRGNALLKARAVALTTGFVSIADDTGLEVDSLGGAPGVMSARYAGPEASYEDNVRKLLADLGGRDDRSARFRTVIAVVDPVGQEWTAEGAVEGLIVPEPRGVYGFGYDPVFEVGGRTLGEMTTEEKSSISHRARALRALAELFTD
ncbi:MAG TPA: RdgB/HAM1 family non-canonical purine NTP pyrophosphatase [Acidimicrobiia bacterium]|nr:RdgB/HAM1 family non-canonical purine NTP pyrophosphatase [Acidimicrobiia bacterium]